MLSPFALCVSATLVLLAPMQEQGGDPIFSGPQVGESVGNFVMTGVFGDQAFQELDVVKQADGGPLLLLFVHERSRPAFGLSNALTRYAASLDPGKLTCGLCYLTSDSSEARNWMNRIQQYFDQSVTIGISADGIEGPGNYGLNRNVALTILVVNQNKVAANFALIQPALQADGQKVIDAVSGVLETKPAPKITQFVNRPNANRRQANNQMSGELESLLRHVINKQATPEQVDRAAAQIEEYLVKHPPQKWRLGAACRRIVNSGRLETYGTTRAQQHISDWSEKYVLLTDRPPNEEMQGNRSKDDSKSKPKQGDKPGKGDKSGEKRA